MLLPCQEHECALNIQWGETSSGRLPISCNQAVARLSFMSDWLQNGSNNRKIHIFGQRARVGRRWTRKGRLIIFLSSSHHEIIISGGIGRWFDWFYHPPARLILVPRVPGPPLMRSSAWCRMRTGKYRMRTILDASPSPQIVILGNCQNCRTTALSGPVSSPKLVPTAWVLDPGLPSHPRGVTISGRLPAASMVPCLGVCILRHRQCRLAVWIDKLTNFIQLLSYTAVSASSNHFHSGSIIDMYMPFVWHWTEWGRGHSVHDCWHHQRRNWQIVPR